MRMNQCAILIVLACITHGAYAHGSHSHGTPSPPCDPTTDNNNCEDLPYGLAWGMNIGAAVSTLVGAFAVIVSPTLRKVLQDPCSPLLVSLLSLSFGVLLWVALVVLQPEAVRLLNEDGVKGCNLIASAIFFGGWGLGYLLEIVSKKVGEDPEAPEPKHDSTSVEFTDDDGDVLKYELNDGVLELKLNGAPLVSPVEWLGWNDQNRTLSDEKDAAPIPPTVDILWIKNLVDSAPNCEWRIVSGGVACQDAAVARQNAANKQKKKNGMLNMACHTSMSLALHNFAEGFVSFVAVIANKDIGVATAIAIMLHNIPEGFVIAVPAWAATNDWRRPLLFTSFATGAEIVAGLIAYCVVRTIDNYSSDSKGIVWMQAILSSLAAGIMAQAALGSLLPHCLDMERRRRIAITAARTVETVDAAQLEMQSAAQVVNPMDNCPVFTAEEVTGKHDMGVAPPAVEEADVDNKSVVMTWSLVGMILMAIVLGLFDIEDM